MGSDPVGQLRLAFLGFGTVNRALHALLERRRDALAREHGVAFAVTGVASRRLGWRAGARALDPHAGQPALDYLRAALAFGAHAVSANKGPVVHGWRELDALAARAGRRY